MRKNVLVVLIAAVAAMVIAGCAAKEDMVSHEEIKGKTKTISTGGFFEACDKWAPGDKVNISFTSSKPVGFNVHYHKKRSSEKIYMVEQTEMDKYDGSFTVESDEVHCAMWNNDNPKYITLTYDMSVAKQ